MIFITITVIVQNNKNMNKSIVNLYYSIIILKIVIKELLLLELILIMVIKVKIVTVVIDRSKLY